MGLGGGRDREAWDSSGAVSTWGSWGPGVGSAAGGATEGSRDGNGMRKCWKPEALQLPHC